jgi:hypothetical protein
MRGIRFVLSSCLIAITSACSSSDPVTTPLQNPDVGQRKDDGGPAGIYVLASVAGAPLPATVVANQGVTAVMLADTMFLHADGTGAVATVERVKETDRPNDYTLRSEAPFTYTITGGRLSAEIPCRDVIVLAACVKPPHYVGTVSSGALDLDYALNLRVPLHFARVAGPTDVGAVQIAPSNDLAVKVGATVQLTAKAVDAAGVALANRKASWMSLLPSAATVSSSGSVRGVAEGITLITAFIEGRADTVTVHVNR